MKDIKTKEIRMHLYGIKVNLINARKQRNAKEIKRLESLKARIINRLHNL